MAMIDVQILCDSCSPTYLTSSVSTTIELQPAVRPAAWYQCCCFFCCFCCRYLIFGEDENEIDETDLDCNDGVHGNVAESLALDRWIRWRSAGCQECA